MYFFGISPERSALYKPFGRMTVEFQNLEFFMKMLYLELAPVCGETGRSKIINWSISQTVSELKKLNNLNSNPMLLQEVT